MYILVNKTDNCILETLSNIDIIDEKWVRSSHGALMQLDMIDVVEVESVPESAKYYIDKTFLSQSEHNKLKKRPNYVARVKQLVRAKYPDVDTELAILRKRIAGIDVSNEFDAYNNYVEDCKTQAKSEFGI
ncbi:MAG: hypothetical protein FGM16_10775 [Flavobacterium sp.]|nr:hypothetical protein [Flavobacterium sp.]